jgi:hypothetical protein
MNYSVFWVPKAEQELAAAWLAAADRAVVTRAAQQIDEQLRMDAHVVGESRWDGDRILFAAPLAAMFRVDAVNQTAHVLHVWRFKTRS